MILKDKPVELKGRDGTVRIVRDGSGVPGITAASMRDASFALGWVHTNDRQIQMMLTRTILQGRLSEKISADPALVEADRYIRSLDLYPDIEDQEKRLEPEVRECTECYAAGVNAYLGSSSPLPEFRLLRFRPEQWKLHDSMMFGKVFTYFGLTDIQGNMEKLILQMVQNDIDESKIRELFPYLTDAIDVELLKKVRLVPPVVPEAVKWISRIPRFTGSNNWAVSGKLTESGMPILCGDPHLEVNRMPAIWHEAVIRLPGDTIIGFGLPGFPFFTLGRNSHFASSPTYSFMDMIDFRIEECRDGMYRRGNRWIPFDVKSEVIKTKKGDEIRLNIYENEHGILEGDPMEAGFYLVRSWSAQRGCGAQELNVLYNIMRTKTVREGMRHFRNLDSASFNFVMADSSGNIGYQMSGRLFARPRGVSGLLPLPGWENRYNSRGYVLKTSLPCSYNPRAGYIVTANQDLNYLGKSQPINLAMAPYRAERIEALLKKRKKLDVEYMKEIHYDLYSLQAERIMKIIFPLLSGTDNGRTLREWDLCYTPDSRGAAIFENVYRSMIYTLFGDRCFGRAAVKHLLNETSMFNDYFGNFDSIIFNRKSVWFRFGTRDDVLRIAVDEGMKRRVTSYGRTRRIYFKHLLFGGKVPSFVGLDAGPVELPGCRATVTQGQIFNVSGRTTTFSPSCRMIADMSDTALLTNMPGGNCDRPYSKWYKNNMKGWLTGVYKKLS